MSAATIVLDVTFDEIPFFLLSIVCLSIPLSSVEFLSRGSIHVLTYILHSLATPSTLLSVRETLYSLTPVSPVEPTWSYKAIRWRFTKCDFSGCPAGVRKIGLLRKIAGIYYPSPDIRRGASVRLTVVEPESNSDGRGKKKVQNLRDSLILNTDRSTDP